MDRVDLVKRVQKFLIRYKYVIAVLLVGVVFMLIPSKEKAEVKEQVSPVIQEISMEEKLEKILSQIEGAGEVRVLLSQASGEEYVYQNNTDSQVNSSGDTTQSDTVIISDSGRNEQGLIKQINPPKYRGAIIICTGGNDPVVRLSVVEAVSNVTGLGVDKITVLKMK